MSKEIKSVRVRPKYEDGDVKFTLYDDFGSKISVRATPLDGVTLGAKFEYRKKDIWVNFTDEQFISDAIYQFATIILSERGKKDDPHNYYDIIQDPWNEKAPVLRNYGYDPYYLNNGSKVYINWFEGLNPRGGFSWSSEKGDELDIERGYTASSKVNITKTVKLEGELLDKTKEIFTINNNNEFSTILDYKVYTGNIKDSDILDEVIKKWKLSVVDYNDLDILDISKNKFQNVNGYIIPVDNKSKLEYKSPVTNRPNTESIAVSNTPITGATSSKIKINIVFPKDFKVNVREDVPEFKIYIGDVPIEEPIEGFTTTSSDDELLNPEYNEGEFQGDEELIQNISYLNNSLSDIPADTPLDLNRVDDDNIDFNSSSFVGDKWKSFNIEKAISLISNTQYKPSNKFKESLKKILFYIKNDDKIKDIREGSYMLATAFAESGYSLQRWEADYTCNGAGIAYGSSGPCSPALKYFRSSKGKKDYYTLGTDSKGFPYFGRGMIQLTGKSNYEKYGKLIGVDLVKNGDLALDPQNSYKIASIYLKGRTFKHVLSGDLTKARKSVNGGTKGISEVNGAYKSWLNILQSLV